MSALRLFKTPNGPVLEDGGRYYTLVVDNFDDILANDDIPAFLRRGARRQIDAPSRLLAPVGSQEIWAAGVTYLRSKSARMEEAEAAGGGDFYDRVYAAQRPEIFYKASGSRAVGPGAPVRIRPDSAWNVPEPELTLVIAPNGLIAGYTIGNDMSSRSIEGENPLYLPQAKCYDGSCAIGPALVFPDEPLSLDTMIDIEIHRSGQRVFSGETSLSQMKRRPADLAAWLCRELSFPVGVLLMTGTGIVPDSGFTLQSGDLVRIRIDGLGELANPVA